MPISKNYKDPTKLAKPAESVGPIVEPDEMPPARPVLDTPEQQAVVESDPRMREDMPRMTAEQPAMEVMPQRPVFRMSDVPLTEDKSGIDYGTFYKNLFLKGAQQSDENELTSQDIADSKNISNTRTIMAGLAKAAADAGGTKSSLGDTFAALNKEDTAALINRKGLADEGRAEALKAVGETEDNDPYSQKSNIARSLVNSLLPGGQKLPDSITAANLSSFLGPITAIATDAANKNFTLKTMGLNQNFEKGQLNTKLAAQAAEKKAEMDARIEAAKAGGKGRDAIFNQLSEPERITVRELSTSAAKKTNISNQIDGYLKELDKAQGSLEKTRVGQQMIKLLNSTEGADAVGAEEARRLANELEPYTLKGPDGLPRIGQDLAGFRERANAVRHSLRNGAQSNNDQVEAIYQKFSNPGAARPASSEEKRRVWTPGGDSK